MKQMIKYGVAAAIVALSPKNTSALHTVIDKGAEYGFAIESQLEKDYIKAGKCDQLEKKINTLAKHLSKKTPVTLSDLLDGKTDNYEFMGMSFDESDPFKQIEAIVYIDPTGEVQSIGKGGLGASDLLFIDPELENMERNIKVAKKLNSFYNGVVNKSGILTQTLDRQAGKVKGVTATWTPSFENQMGFTSEKEMRDVLANTDKIEVDYKPNSNFSLKITDDFSVTYNLKDGSNVNKFVGPFPLSVFLTDKQKEQVDKYDSKLLNKGSEKRSKRKMRMMKSEEMGF